MFPCGNYFQNEPNTEPAKWTHLRWIGNQRDWEGNHPRNPESVSQMEDLLADLGNGLTELTALYPGRSAHRIQGVPGPPKAGNSELLLSPCELTVAGLTLSLLGGFSSELSLDVHRADINTAVETACSFDFCLLWGQPCRSHSLLEDLFAWPWPWKNFNIQTHKSKLEHSIDITKIL